MPVHSQQATGQPFLVNYTSKIYGASPQNWSVVQDSKGIIYVANNSGVLEFDGERWRKIPVTNRSAVGSLAIDSNDVIYVGATGEFGYLQPDSIGQLKYVSCMPKIESKYHDFADVWHTHILNGKVYYQSYKYIFILSGDSIQVIQPDKLLHRSYVVHNRLYVRQRGVGLMTLNGNRLERIPGGEIFKDESVFAMLPYDSTRILIGTRKKNLLLYDGHVITPFPTTIDSFLSQSVIYNGLRHDSLLIFATRRSGLIFFNLQGRLVRILNKSSGMHDEVINYAYVDAQRGLWAATNNGLTRLEVFRPVTFFNEATGLKGIVLSVTRHKNRIYAASGFGLYVMNPVSHQKHAPPEYRFEPVSAITAQSWHFLGCGKSLLVATSDGIYEVSDAGTARIRSEGGGFFLLRSRRDSTLVLAGLRDGVALLRLIAGQWYDMGRVPGIEIDARVMVEMPDGYLWIGTSFRGVIRVDLRHHDPASLSKESLKTKHFIVDKFGPAQGLPYGGVFVFTAGQRLLFGTEKGLYRFDASTRRFYPDTSLGKIFADSSKSIDVITEDRRGHIWLHANDNNRSENYLLLPQNDATYRPLTIPFLRFTDYSVLTIFPDSDHVTWFGGADGLFRYHQDMAYDFQTPFRTLIRNIYIHRDSLIWGGHGNSPVRKVSYSDHSLRFECSASFYDSPADNQFQYWLEGLDKEWSPWTKASYKEYTSLSEGAYRFRVRSKNIYGLIGEESFFIFEILPPWYRAGWAYIFYACVFVLAVYQIIRWRAGVLEREKHRLETIVAERTNALTAKTNQLEKINSMVKTINYEIELDKLLKALMSQLKNIQGADRLAVLAWDDTRRQFQFVAADGWDMEKLGGIYLTAEEAERRYAKHAEEARPDIFIIRDSSILELNERFTAVGLSQAMLIMRIRTRDDIQAYFIFDNMNRNRAFDGQDLDLLDQLREHITLAFMKSKLLEELRRLNEKKNEFLGIAAHDLRSPLNVIVGFVSMITEELRENTFDAQAGLKDLENVLKAAKGMIHLLSELLDISAIEAGKVILNLSALSISSLFEECKRNHTKIAAQKNINLTFGPADLLPPVQADRVRILEVMDNLISNAVKYTFPGGLVTVTARSESNQVIIAVTDTGQGLDAEDLKSIFHSYKKLSARPTGGEPSTGLGLAIVKKIVDMHGGTVSVESLKGKGSTFRFTLKTLAAPTQ